MKAFPWNQSTILAPLTKGGHLPFRRLCVELGAPITTSEMAYARKLIGGRGTERPLLRHHDSEQFFGVQLAVSQPEEAAEAGRIAESEGARFIDINCGCPIHDAIRRGLGASLMQRPLAIGRLVESLVAAVDIPVTVKIRSGWSEKKINALRAGEIAEQAGASAITLHARSRQQRYSKSADWSLIRNLSEALSIPVIGNGDILTWYEAEDRKEASGVDTIMIGRGALIKPWIFKEITEKQDWLPSADERIEIYLRLITYMKEHFGDDAKGKKKAMYFLPFHFDFFTRYRPFPETHFRLRSQSYPLIQSRVADLDSDPDPLESILRDPRETSHTVMAEIFWEAKSVSNVKERLLSLPATPEPKEDSQSFSISTG